MKKQIIHLKRFQATRSGFREKITSFVDFPLENLDLSKYVLKSANGQSNVYNLFAVSDHSGGLSGGHYTACAKVGSSWYDFNDSHVTTISASDVKSPAAYLLFYERVS